MALGSNDDKFIKKPNVTTKYNDQQIKDILACSDPITGPQYFIENFMWIQHPTRGAQIIEMYEYQKELLKSYVKYRKSVSLMGRQQGKCLDSSTKICIRNKNTGEIKEITIGEFHEICR